MNKLGIRLTPDKQKAFLHGDISGAVIHPFFVQCSQVVGMYFSEGMDNSPIMAQLLARNTQMAFDSLMKLFEERDWELMAHVAVWIMAGSIVLRLSGTVRLYIKESCEALSIGGLQFVPTYGQPPGFSEELHEKLSTLSQIIYFENFTFLTSGGAMPTLTTKIEMEFRQQLPVRSVTSFLRVVYSMFPHRECIRCCSRSVR